MARAAATVAAIAAASAVAGGCGSENSSDQSAAANHGSLTTDRSTTTTTTTEAGAQHARNPAKHAAPLKARGGAKRPAAVAPLRSCLQRHGVTLPALAGGGGTPGGGKPGSPNGLAPKLGAGKGNLHAKVRKLRAAGEACRGELPKNPAKALSAGAVKRMRERARRSVAQQFKRVEALRACLGRRGFGPEAQSRSHHGDIRKAFADCAGQPQNGQSDTGTRAPGK